jgi:hypothetical protein
MVWPFIRLFLFSDECVLARDVYDISFVFGFVSQTVGVVTLLAIHSAWSSTILI